MATAQRQAVLETAYRLDDQIGFIMRQANQRHLAIFGRNIGDFTPTQFATLAKIHEIGTVSQNDLGRQTAMDAATMKGVIDRLSRKGLVTTRPDPTDLRRLLVELTQAGLSAYLDNVDAAVTITEETLAPLNEQERTQLADLLEKMVKAK